MDIEQLYKQVFYPVDHGWWPHPSCPVSSVLHGCPHESPDDAGLLHCLTRTLDILDWLVGEMLIIMQNSSSGGADDLLWLECYCFGLDALADVQCNYLMRHSYILVFPHSQTLINIKSIYVFMIKTIWGPDVRLFLVTTYSKSTFNNIDV